MLASLLLRSQQYFALLKSNRLGGQTLIAFGLKILNAGASFLLSLIIARTFGAAGIGMFGIAVTTISILSFIVLVGLDYTLIRVVSGDLREGNKAAARGVVATEAGGVLLIAPPIVGLLWLARAALSDRLLNQPALSGVLGIMLLGILPLGLQRIASASLRASGRAISSQVIDGPLGTSLAVIGFAATLWLSGAVSLRAPAYFYVAGLFVGAGAGWLIYFFTVRDWPKAIPTPLGPMLVAGLPLVATSLANTFTEWYTTVALGWSWPAEIVGQYRAAWQFVAFAGLMQIAMEMMIGPRIAAASRVGAKNEIASIARKSIALGLIVGGPLFVTFLVFPAPLLGILGAEFKAGAPVLQILAIGQVIRIGAGPLGVILIMTGNQRWVMGSSAASLIVCIGIVAWLVPTYGAVGAAIATGTTVTFRSLATAIFVYRVLGINLFHRSSIVR